MITQDLNLHYFKITFYSISDFLANLCGVNAPPPYILIRVSERLLALQWNYCLYIHLSNSFSCVCTYQVQLCWQGHHRLQGNWLWGSISCGSFDRLMWIWVPSLLQCSATCFSGVSLSKQSTIWIFI